MEEPARSARCESCLKLNPLSINILWASVSMRMALPELPLPSRVNLSMLNRDREMVVSTLILREYSRGILRVSIDFSGG